MLRGCTQRRTFPVCHNGLELIRKGHKSSTCRIEEKPALGPGASMWLSSMLYSHLVNKNNLCKEMLKEYWWEWQQDEALGWKSKVSEETVKHNELSFQLTSCFETMNRGVGSAILASLEKVENKGHFFILHVQKGAIISVGQILRELLKAVDSLTEKWCNEQLMIMIHVILHILFWYSFCNVISKSKIKFFFSLWLLRVFFFFYWQNIIR